MDARAIRASLTPFQHIRLVVDPERPSLPNSGFDYSGMDLRLVADALGRVGVRRPVGLVTTRCFHGRRPTSYRGCLESAAAWPFFLEHPGGLDDALGLAVPGEPKDEPNLIRALGVLAAMPVLPRRYLPRVVDLAIAGKARPRRAARGVVETHGDPVAVAREGMRHGRAPVRESAAAWLADLEAAR